MGFVPKGVRRKLDAMSHVRANTAATLAIARIQVTAQVHKEAGGDVPRRLELGVTPTRICNAYDVYLNGQRQHLCIIADVDKGFIKRYVRGVGRKPVANKNGAFDTERLFGKVEIIPKGTKRDTGRIDGEDAGATDSSSSDPAST